MHLPVSAGRRIDLDQTEPTATRLWAGYFALNQKTVDTPIVMAQAPPEAARSDLDAGENGGSLIEAGVRSLCAECGRVVVVLPGRQHSAVPAAAK